MTNEDLEDFLETAIMESIDLDWVPRDAAKLIVSRMRDEGLVLVETGPDAKLLPCPFCGGEAELRESVTDAAVACCDCGARTGFVYFGASEAANAAKKRDLSTAWNTRATHCTTCTEATAAIIAAAEARIEEVNRYHKKRLGTYKAALQMLNEATARAEAADARIKVLEEALTQLRDCDWIITLPDRMDAVRDIARTALKGSTDADHVRGTLGDSDGDDGA